MQFNICRIREKIRNLFLQSHMRQQGQSKRKIHSWLTLTSEKQFLPSHFWFLQLTFEYFVG